MLGVELCATSSGLAIDVVHRDVDRVNMCGPEGDPDHGQRRARREARDDDAARGTFEVMNKLGLHARAATKLVQLASQFPCEIVVSREGQAANAKSVMGVLLLCGSKGTHLDIEATGIAPATAVEAIGELIDARFGEPE